MSHSSLASSGGRSRSLPGTKTTFYGVCTRRFAGRKNCRRRTAERCGVPSAMWEVSSAIEATETLGERGILWSEKW